MLNIISLDIFEFFISFLVRTPPSIHFLKPDLSTFSNKLSCGVNPSACALFPEYIAPMENNKTWNKIANENIIEITCLFLFLLKRFFISFLP